MSILSGFFKTKKYRKTSNGYKLQSEWTSSQTVEMDNGDTLQKTMEDMNTEMSGVKKSVADGKKLLAGSISKYFQTAGDADFIVLDTNMNKAFGIRHASGVSETKVGTAGAAQVLSGYTFTNSGGVGIAGSMPDNGGWVGTMPDAPTNGSYRAAVPKGFHDGTGYVDGISLYNAGKNKGKEEAAKQAVNFTSGSIITQPSSGATSFDNMNVTLEKGSYILTVSLVYGFNGGDPSADSGSADHGTPQINVIRQLAAGESCTLKEIADTESFTGYRFYSGARGRLITYSVTVDNKAVTLGFRPAEGTVKNDSEGGACMLINTIRLT